MILRPRSTLPLVGLGFFASGAAALVYQVVWQRLLVLQTGVGVYSVALIVASFMAGLGLGSHLGGVVSVRLNPRRALLAFAAVELTIALFGLVSVPLYYDLLYARAGAIQPAPLAAALQFAVLVPPTALMGLSLPLLARATVRDVASAARTLGLLYGLNTLGAAAGALLAPWVLVRHFGLGGAVVAAAAANALAAVLALALLAWGQEPPPVAIEAASPLAEPAGRHPLALWLALYCASGFCALSLEILWFRLLEVAARPTAFTFGTLLAIYLAGSALGCLLVAGRAPRFERPLRIFLICECALLAWAGLTVVALVELPVRTPGLAWLWAYWRSGGVFHLGSAWDPGALLGLYLLLPLVLFGPPTVLMGIAFPALQRAVQDDVVSSGRKVGLMQAANILGCVGGSLAIGLVGLQWLGTSGSLRVLLLAGAGFAAVGVVVYGRRSLFVPALLVLAATAVALPGNERLWKRLHGAESPLTLVAEDATSVCAVVPVASGWRVVVDGSLHSSIPFGGIHTRLGATPALVHPSPREVAIIGLGSGDTAWASGCRPETERITVFEVAGRQHQLLRRLAARELPDLRALLADPRLQVVTADGRHALATGRRRYDVIEADALWPYSGYSGHLYSVEFFRVCAARLRPGGLMCTWAPTPRIAAAFTAVFPHVLMPPDRSFLVGSNEAIPGGAAVWQARAADPRVRLYLGPGLSAEIHRSIGRLMTFVPPSASPVRPDRDLEPRDEFLTPY